MEQIRNFIEKEKLIKKGSRVVIGLSGGPDSVFLLHFLTQLKKNGTISELICAHLDHEWRADSHKDVAFCHEIAKKYDIPLAVAKLSDLALSSKKNGSKEADGRNARRQFLQNVKQKHNADLIALGHHAQDQQETFFIRLARGATLTGLTGMQPKRGVYIRPLLTTDKKNILNFLDTYNIPYLVDPSNKSDAFLRNRIRNNLFPELHKTDSRFATKLTETMESLRDTEKFLQQLTRTTFQSVATKAKSGFSVDTTKLFALHPVLYKRVVLHWLCQENVPFPASRGFLEEIIKFLRQQQGGVHNLHHNWKIVKKKGKTSIQSSQRLPSRSP